MCFCPKHGEVLSLSVDSDYTGTQGLDDTLEENTEPFKFNFQLSK